MPVDPNVCCGKGGPVARSAIALAKIAFHFKIELFRKIASQIDPRPAQPKSIVYRSLAKPAFERRNIAVFKIHLNEPAEHQLQLRSPLLDVNWSFLLDHRLFDI